MEALGTILLSEIAGTAVLTLLGGGVVANVVLGKTKGNGGGWLLINFGWGLAVFAGVWVAYKNHYDQETDPGAILGTFSTGPEIRSKGWNLVTEIIATFVLVFVIIMFGHTPHGLGPLAVALLVVAIGASLGGPTGYAINPARDLGPRLAHAILPIRNKGGSDWGYSWVPIAGPMIGGALAGLASILYF